ncbi:hypothetical protein JJB27_08970 [Campylobacter fetus subsp. venerealis]|uniref:hypothetical protein n=1 Tax=Campylobacter fetus TaxID=196 RepID=UPI00190C1CC2|nr:hypothetical protein [Campylobacter fetus]MBK3499195.1 hypothetical protein [Campylobacter fetus subsp. venerealis]MBK3503154.1 hypothetical protein [Campylobacter fetus subsp. venerealis]HDX6244492.1 hypothetical protein [Campylobacter fetus subsp. venerealis]HDX6324062.1 hypothetical protein [Campylobacter fetus subsp. venerealis]
MKIFEKIKNTFSQIGKMIKAKFTDKEQQYPNFVLGKESKLYFTDKIKFELGEYLKKYTDINDNPIVASINYLYNHHKNDMFISKREVYKLIKEVLDSIPEIVRKQNDGTYYFAKSLKHEKSNKKSVMADIVLEIGEAENYIKHLNKKPYSKEMRETMTEKEKAVSSESVKSSHSRQAAKTLDKNPALTRPQEPVSNLLTANDEIIPQETKQSNIADNITKIPERDFKVDVLSNNDKNDSTAMDETRDKYNAENLDTDTDKNDGDKNSPRKNKR